MSGSKRLVELIRATQLKQLVDKVNVFYGSENVGEVVGVHYTKDGKTFFALVDYKLISASEDNGKGGPKGDQQPYLQKYGNKSLREMEFEFSKEIILNAVDEVRTYTQAAELLQISTSTLFNKMQKYGIERLQ